MTSLTELGLSSYEEQAYRALLATGPAPARTVADRSGVPTGRIYDVLEGLRSRGLVRSTDGDPRQYAPCDPEAAVETLLARRLDDLETEADRYRDLAAAARERLAPTPPVEGNVWLSDLDEEDSVTLIGELLSSVTDRFAMAVGTPYTGAAVEDYREEVAAFVDNLPTDASVDVLLADSLVEPLSEFLPRPREGDATVTIRQRSGIDVTFEVADGTEAWIDVPHPFVDGRRVGFVEVREPRLATELEGLFDEAWARADPVE